MQASSTDIRSTEAGLKRKGKGKAGFIYLLSSEQHKVTFYPRAKAAHFPEISCTNIKNMYEKLKMKSSTAIEFSCFDLQRHCNIKKSEWTQRLNDKNDILILYILVLKIRSHVHV